MDLKRRKELIMEYQNRKPEMGVVSYRCKETGEAFLGISEDTRATINSMNTKLNSGYHPNIRLFGLEKLREECLEADEKAKRIWSGRSTLWTVPKQVG